MTKAKKTRTEEVHFTVEGQFIAEMARTRMQEGSYQSGLRILECLEGMSLEQQISILRGKATLTGENSQVYLVEEEPEVTKAMEDWHQEEFGPIFEFKDKLFKPYAYVQSWSRDDLPKSSSRFSSLANSFTREFESELFDKMDDSGWGELLADNPHSRSLFYAENSSQDLALTVDANKVKNLPFSGKAVVLFKQVTEQLPFWAQEYYSKTPFEAVSKLAKVSYSLRKEGAEYYNDSDIVKDFSPNPEAEDLSKQSKEDMINTPEYKEARRKFIDQYTDKAEEKRWREHDEYVEEVRQKIIAYADNDKEYGWKHLEDRDGNVLKVPGRAFLHFAIKRGDYMNRTGDHNATLPDYEPIAPRELKMMNDDPLHTDCWLGAGLPLNTAYEHETWQHKLFFEKMFDIQTTYFDDDFNILNRADKKEIKGTIVNPYNYESVPKGERILVIPHLGVEFEVVALQCDAIICETGGKLAHLATVGREMGIPIIRIENAVVAFALPRKIEIDLLEGKIKFPKDEQLEPVKEKNKKKKI
jgi:phosphohistidine swiveling domain-containing protein